MKTIYQQRIALGFTSAALTAVACAVVCLTFRFYALREEGMAQERAEEIRHMYLLMPTFDTAPVESTIGAEPEAHRMGKKK